LDQDVAGATFMAIGSSAPEVFISLVSIFVSDANPGIGSIVGSAVFNILFVMGVCSLLVANVNFSLLFTRFLCFF
jgi:Ca2+/Na+ antiporter